MRLASFREARGGVRLGIVDDDRIVDGDTLGGDVPGTMEAVLAGGTDAVAVLTAAWAAAGKGALADARSLSTVELLAPLPRRPGKIVAVGLNYRRHAAEGGQPIPKDPILFAKFPTCVVGPGAAIEWDPGLTSAVDYEAELAVVIGRRARQVSAGNALDHVLGYTCMNDVSARDLQFADRQFVRAKSLDTFGPMGPVIVTRDEIPDPQRLRVRALLNGEVLQDESTSDMIFGVVELVAFCSRAFTLEPGDVIATGTPSGVGWYRNPKRLLRDGDEIVVEIERIGRLANPCREVRPSG